MSDEHPSAAHVSMAAGLDRGDPRVPDLDPEAPRDVHESHTFVAFDRWLECSDCGARDHWGAATVKCEPRGVAAKGRPVPLAQALDNLREDLIAFGVWWETKDLGPARPDMPEWCAEFLTWTHNRGGRL